MANFYDYEERTIGNIPQKKKTKLYNGSTYLLAYNDVFKSTMSREPSNSEWPNKLNHISDSLHNCVFELVFLLDRFRRNE